MSEPLDLAASIRANTAAVQALTAAFLRSHPTALAKVDVAAARAELFDAAETEIAPQAEVEVEVEERGTFTLDAAKKVATTLAKKDREALAALLVQFKADKVSLLKPEQYRAFILAARQA
jgi:hypothetical protein